LASIDLSILGASILGLLIALGLGYYFSKSFLKPIRSIIDSARRASAGNYETRISTKTYDETDQLIQALNEMYQHLHEIETLRKELVANLSHELSTPLTNIYGYLSALSDDVVKTKKKRNEAIELVTEEVERLIILIKELKKLAVVDSESTNLFLQPADINELLKKTAESFCAQLKANNLELKLELDDDLPSTPLDKAKMRQVFVNLLDNAIKYSKAGGKITISSAQEGEKVKVVFADTGIGISEKDLPLIFERFFQADRSRSQKKGIGIGLAIVQKIVHAHQGRIAVDSSLGEGSRFTLQLSTNQENKS